MFSTFRNTTLATIVAGLAMAMTGHAVAGELPKEGTFSLTNYIHSVWDGTETTPKHSAWTWETYSIMTNDAGSGFLHNVATHCFGSGGSTNADGGTLDFGNCALIDADGDRILARVQISRSRSGEPRQEDYIFVDGTGKYAGIQGKAELTGSTKLKGFPDASSSHGNILAISHTKGSYKLVGATQ
jgi:hypothetical protein